MSSPGTQQSELGTQTYVRELNDIRQIAEVRMMEFYELRQRETVVDSIDSNAVREAHIQFQNAVTAYIGKLRPYIKDSPVYGERDLDPEGDEEWTMAQLIQMQGETETQRVESGDMFDPDQVERVEVPKLAPSTALRNALYILVEKQEEQGFLPASRRRPRSTDSR